MQLTIKKVLGHFSLTRFFPDTFLTFSKIPDTFLTAVNFPDISRFSRQLVTLCTISTQINRADQHELQHLLSTPLDTRASLG